MPEHYSLLDGVMISPEIEVKVKQLADNYHALTNKDIVVTSGIRTAQRQAEAMYAKLAGGDDLAVYKNQDIAQAIRKIYIDGTNTNQTEETIITAIRTEIDKQIAKGIFISQHLRKGAVDIRSRDMSDAEKAQFRVAAEGIAETVILETTPPHFHVQLS